MQYLNDGFYFFFWGFCKILDIFCCCSSKVAVGNVNLFLIFPTPLVPYSSNGWRILLFFEYKLKSINLVLLSRAIAPPLLYFFKYAVISEQKNFKETFCIPEKRFEVLISWFDRELLIFPFSIFFSFIWCVYSLQEPDITFVPPSNNASLYKFTKHILICTNYMYDKTLNKKM